MKTKLVAGRLLASSYGDKFSPTSGRSPDVWAGNFDIAAAFEAAVQKCKNEFVSSDLRDVKSGLDEAKTFIEGELSSSGAFTLVTANGSFYRPIRDSSGEIIGHDSVLWLFENNAPIVMEEPEGASDPSLGLIACAYLAGERVDAK